MTKKRSIFGKRRTALPYDFPWAYDLTLAHEKLHWLPQEVSLDSDMNDWRNKLDAHDREFLENVFLLFTQSDVDVLNGYIKYYFKHFHLPELQMGLASIAAREAIHIIAYSYILETLGKSDEFYGRFVNIPTMLAKHDFSEFFLKGGKKPDLMLQIAGLSGLTEGMFLFSSFAMLLNYQRQGLMRGMGTIVTWSILDEQLHVKFMTNIFREIREEYPELFTPQIEEAIRGVAHRMTMMEFDFINTVYGDLTEIRNLKKADLREFVMSTVDARLEDLGIEPIHGARPNPLPWFDEEVNSQTHTNFFEATSTSYAVGATQGNWSDVWGNYKR